MKKPVMLMIYDGFGLTDNVLGNAVKAANLPNYHEFEKKYPYTTIEASGLAVGLPEGQMGNSEVGHMNIGAGRVVYQELTRITKNIKEGEFFRNTALNLAMDKALENNSDVHLLGLLSDGGVHSHIDHVKALIKLAKEKKVRNVFLHAFLDGRDVSPTSGADFLNEILNFMREENFGKIATVSGRYYAMDRDNRWERIEKAYNVMVREEGESTEDVINYVKDSYKNEVTDEFMVPVVVRENGNPVGQIKDNDSVIFFNFRPDRAREMTRALNDRVFDGFKRDKLDLTYVTMTQYDKTLENVNIAYMPQSLDNTLGEYVSKLGKNQLRIAETEKYAHVTFFFNGGVEKPNVGEERILVQSPKVATYDLKPEMSAKEVSEKLLKALEENKFDLIIANYANPDMLGHTGVMEAVKEGLEYIDTWASEVIRKVISMGGSVFLTADHGNCEQLIDYETGGPMTAHTTNPVPFIYMTENPQKTLRTGGVLADIAPTILEEMGLEVPTEMTGKSLLVSK